MIKIRENVPLAQYTNYKIGGKALYFVELTPNLPMNQNRVRFRVQRQKEALNIRQKGQYGDYAELVELLLWAEKKGLPVFVLGGGTNILVSDDGFEGLVVKVKDIKDDIKIVNPKFEIRNPCLAGRQAKQIQNSKFKIQNSEYITVSAGTKLSDLVNFSLRNGLSGLEWAAGIPGTVGGAIRGNAGAFGGEMSNVVESVVAIVWKDRTKHLNKFSSLNDADINAEQTPSVNQRRYQREFRVVALSNKQCGFGYRTSIIKEKGGIILEATLCLKKLKISNYKLKIIEEAQGHINHRKEHHPLEYPSCGSTFKNVFLKALKNAEQDLPCRQAGAEQRRNLEKITLRQSSEQGEIQTTEGDIIPAGLLIAKAGLSGKRIGDTQISEKHSNFIVNLGKAKASDVYALIQLCEKKVYEKFGIKLEREVELVGFADQR